MDLPTFGEHTEQQDLPDVIYRFTNPVSIATEAAASNATAAAATVTMSKPATSPAVSAAATEPQL